MDHGFDVEFLSSPTILVVGVTLALLPVLFLYLREPDLPGEVKRSGKFSVFDPADDAAMEERRRDFTRNARSLQGVMTCKDGELDHLFKDEHKIENYEDALKILEGWFKENNISVKADKIVPLLSVTPGFDFLMKHKIPPTTKQDCYVLIAGLDGEFRVLWTAYCTDVPKPNQVAGPFILHLMSENLAGKIGNTVNYTYTMRSNTSHDMKEHLKNIRTHLAKAGKGMKDAILHM